MRTDKQRPTLRNTPRGQRRRPLGPGGRAWKLAAAALLCAAACLSCSEDPTVSVTTQCLAFLPDEGTAPGHVIARTGAESTCNELDIEIVATEIEGIFAADIQITYATGLSIVRLVQAGPLLLGSGESVACDLALAEYGVDCFVTDDFENSTIDIGISRMRGTGTVDAPPEGAVLLTLTFLQLTTLPGAQGGFDFTRGKLLDNAEPLGNIINVWDDPSTFVGGQMIIEQR